MRISANGVAIEVEDQGPPGGPALLLLMGLGMQLVAWPEPFVRSLVARGFRVIRMDNRDAGWSQGFDAQGAPNLMWQGLWHAMRLPVQSAYSLDDMADDALAVLDAMGLDAAHVVGLSMGGMIAQLMALKAQHRVRSLTLMMTTPGGHGLPGPTVRARAAMLAAPPRVRLLPGPDGSLTRPDPRDLPALVEHLSHLLAVIGSPAYPVPDDEMRRRIEPLAGRAWRPQGTARQLTAIMAAPARAGRLRACRLPTQVIHGRDDPLVPIAHAHALVDAIPGARLREMPGMGHDLPAPLWQTFSEQIAELAGHA